MSWIKAVEIVPGYLVRSPYGSRDVVLEINEAVHYPSHVELSGWKVNTRTWAEKHFTGGKWRKATQLWFIADQRGAWEYPPVRVAGPLTR
ncbi:hypothetical protein GCM10010466_39400 [Planomonospora alba]|uniref:LTD domain-containing protein n=1 Tax=Planomonospora alba TaxID=161354 RepID=A0ABP6NE35_9ACTN